MEILKINNKIDIKFSFNELLIIHNSLNEVCNGFQVRNFESTIGTSEEQAEGLLNITCKLLTSMIEEGKTNGDY
jgi:hypothetical protein